MKNSFLKFISLTLVFCLIFSFASCKKEQVEIQEKLLAEANKKDSYASDSWKEYLNQLNTLRQGKKIRTGKVAVSHPDLTIAPLKKF